MEKKLITNCKYDLKFNYYVTDDGRVWSEQTNKFLSPQLDKDGYEKVQMMSTDGKRHRYSVHRLIMENFKPVDNMENLQVDHVDCNKRNNNLNNLEWVINKENTIRAHKNNLCKEQHGENNTQSELKEYQVLEIIERLKNHDYKNYHEMAVCYNVSDDAIGQIKHKERWTYLTKDITF